MSESLTALRQMSSAGAPRVFVSSAWAGGLGPVRSRLGDRLEAAGYAVFLFERFRTEDAWDAHGVVANESLLLHEVEQSDFLISIFGKEYGSSHTHHLADIGLTDLEFFEAIRRGIPVRAYVLDSIQPRKELASLLQIVRALIPGAVVNVHSPADLYERALSDVNGHFVRQPRTERSFQLATKYLRSLIPLRRGHDERFAGLRFLLDRYPAPSRSFDRSAVEAKLSQAEQVRPHARRLHYLWDVFQVLFSVPWQNHPDSLDLWDRTLGGWGKSSAWSGQHGLLYAGTLAATNTLLMVRALAASGEEHASLESILASGGSTPGTPEPWLRLYELGGALGSEYYSVARMSPRRLRSYFFQKADRWCEVAERCRAIERRAGLEPNLEAHAAVASIRGEVRMRLGDAAASISQLSDSLRFRQEARLELESVAWAQVALGYAQFVLNVDRRVGAETLEAATRALEGGRSPEFTVRAKKRLTHVMARQLRFRDAQRERDSALALAKRHQLLDQVADLEAMIPRPFRMVLRLLGTPSRQN